MLGLWILTRWLELVWSKDGRDDWGLRQSKVDEVQDSKSRNWNGSEEHPIYLEGKLSKSNHFNEQDPMMLCMPCTLPVYCSWRDAPLLIGDTRHSYRKVIITFLPLLPAIFHLFLFDDTKLFSLASRVGGQLMRDNFSPTQTSYFRRDDLIRGNHVTKI